MNQLTFKSLEGENKISIWKHGSPKLKIFKYKVDDEDWKLMNVNEQIPLSSDSSISFKSQNEYCSSDKENYYFFHVEGEGKVEVQGSINSLINDNTKLSEFVFYKLFHDIRPLVNASNLQLNSITLARGCYQCLFENDVNLQNAPQLPALYLAQSCYLGMFRQCIKLLTAPSILPATKLYNKCYAHMFEKCIRLRESPIIKADHPTQGSCNFMFYCCSSLTKITTYFKVWNVDYISTDVWVNCVCNPGEFHKLEQLDVIKGKNFIPKKWSSINIQE